MHIGTAGPIAYATFARFKFAPTFKIRPYKLGRRPLQGLRPGPWPVFEMRGGGGGSGGLTPPP